MDIISNSILKVQISQHGAELQSIKKNGKESQEYLILVRSNAMFRKQVFSQIKQPLYCLKC